MPPPRASILRAMARVAMGKSDGIQGFPGTVQGFLVSLMPLVAFPIAGTILLLQQGGGLAAIGDLFATIAVLLAAPVLSYEFARLWRREAWWLRFATAFNWCQWLLPLLASVLLVVLGVLQHAGLSDRAATGLLVLCLGAYGLWLHWFLARHGLALSVLRAVLLVVGVNLVTALLVLAPRLLVMYRP
jgi:hypothetical protein